MGLLLADLLCVFASLWLAPFLYLYLWSGQAAHIPLGYLLNPWWLAALMIQIYLFYVVDLYEAHELAKGQTGTVVASRAAVAVIGTVLIFVVLYFFTRHFADQFPRSRGTILFYGPVVFVTVVGIRMLINRAWPVPRHARNVMLVDGGGMGPKDLSLVKAALDDRNSLKGIVTLSRNGDARLEDVEIRRIASANELSSLVSREQIEELILVGGCEQHPPLVRELVRLSYQGATLLDPIEFFERSTARLPCDYMTDASFLSFHLSRPRLLYSRIKRLMDVGLALVGLALTLPVTVVAGALIRLTSKGPIFFRQERVGLDGKPFMLLKFRTMVDQAEADTGPTWAEKDDPRITPVGRFLRKTRLDELPQLVNIIKGEMSLIGPRPERPEFVGIFEQEIPYYRERLAVRPGITGWAQVRQGYAAGTTETKQKLGYDLFYLKNQSPYLDLLIMFMTLKKMLRAGGQ